MCSRHRFVFDFVIRSWHRFLFLVKFRHYSREIESCRVPRPLLVQNMGIDLPYQVKVLMEHHAFVYQSLRYFALVFAVCAIKIAARDRDVLKIVRLFRRPTLLLILLVFLWLSGLSSHWASKKWTRQVLIVKLLQTLPISFGIVENLHNLSRSFLDNIN